MLLRIRLILRLFKENGDPINEQEYSTITSRNSCPYVITGLEEEETSVNLVGVDVSRDSFKGRGVSERFFDAIGEEMGKLSSFLATLNDAAFKQFAKQGFRSDLLIACNVDEDTMSFALPHDIVFQASRLGLPLELLVDPEG